MPYPTMPPKSKHDLETTVSPSSSTSPFLNSTVEIINALATSNYSSNNITAKLIATIYTYKDAPQKPLSKKLVILGYCKSSLDIIQTVCSPNEESITKCVVGVKRADAEPSPSLGSRDMKNSTEFAKCMQYLRKQRLVAITGRDSVGRFGVLYPYDGSSGAEDDYACDCYVGDVHILRSPNPLEDNKMAVDAPSTNEKESLWQPSESSIDDSSLGIWQPPVSNDFNTNGLFSNGDAFDAGETNNIWGAEGGVAFSSESNENNKRHRFDSNDDEENPTSTKKFHADSGAAAADAFYSGLTRSLDTRADSRLYHMRAFNGWVKATQIAELDPRVGGSKSKPRGGKSQPLRVLDLACGKGGDLGKWVIHQRGIRNYVGIDVARGSLRDAALRARRMRKALHNKCVFICADLGADVPGRPKNKNNKKMQKLNSWTLSNEPEHECGDPLFVDVAGGGISLADKFDVVSIQFAIHYMMSSRKRARRFFNTVSELLDVGGNLVATTVDARVVLDHMMGMGLDLHKLAAGVSNGENGGRVSNSLKSGEEETVTVKVGGGACRLKFDQEVVKRIFYPRLINNDMLDEDLFGLEYTFTLVEGEDHAAGLGQAVDLPEWLTPLPVFEELAREAGLQLDYAQNFHEFYANRKDPLIHHTAHTALYNMKVLDRNGSISEQEWEISRMYMAVKFSKVRESSIVFEDESDEEEEEEEQQPPPRKEIDMSAPMAKKMFPMAMMKAKKAVGSEAWNSFSNEEKKDRTNAELEKLLCT